jgi:hypothetical protein
LKCPAFCGGKIPLNGQVWPANTLNILCWWFTAYDTLYLVLGGALIRVQRAVEAAHFTYRVGKVSKLHCAVMLKT